MILDDFWFTFNIFITEKGMSAWSPLDANTVVTMSISSFLALGRPLSHQTWWLDFPWKLLKGLRVFR